MPIGHPSGTPTALTKLRPGELKEHGPAIDSLLLFAGRGAYPIELAASARAQGVRRIFCIAFKGETDRRMRDLADEIRWMPVGRLRLLLDTAREAGIRDAVMVGQITPTKLYRVQMDRMLIRLLRTLHPRNAETIFGAFAELLTKMDIHLHPASRFMESTMPDPGLLGRRAPDAAQEADIRLGVRIAQATSGLDIGQTVVIKEGTVLAVEAFEGTDQAIRRAGRLGGPGAVVVKTAKRGHDMRFDIPVIGMRTMKHMRRAHVGVLAVEAHRTILLERARLEQEANRLGLVFLAFNPLEHADDAGNGQEDSPS